MARTWPIAVNDDVDMFCGFIGPPSGKICIRFETREGICLLDLVGRLELRKLGKLSQRVDLCLIPKRVCSCEFVG